MRIDHVGTKAQAHLRAMNPGVEKTAVVVETLSGDRLVIYVAGLEGLLIGTLRDAEVNPQQGDKFWLDIETGELTHREYTFVHVEETPVAMVSVPETIEDGFVCSAEFMDRMKGGGVDLSIFGQPPMQLSGTIDVKLTKLVGDEAHFDVVDTGALVTTVTKQFDRTVLNGIYVLDVATGKLSPK